MKTTKQKPMTEEQTRKRIKEYHNKLIDTINFIDDLVELGENYAYFMSAQSSHKNLKKIKKLLEYVG